MAYTQSEREKYAKKYGYDYDPKAIQKRYQSQAKDIETGLEVQRRAGAEAYRGEALGVESQTRATQEDVRQQQAEMGIVGGVEQKAQEQIEQASQTELTSVESGREAMHQEVDTGIKTAYSEAERGAASEIQQLNLQIDQMIQTQKQHEDNLALQKELAGQQAALQKQMMAMQQALNNAYKGVETGNPAFAMDRNGKTFVGSKDYSNNLDHIAGGSPQTGDKVYTSQGGYSYKNGTWFKI